MCFFPLSTSFFDHCDHFEQNIKGFDWSRHITVGQPDAENDGDFLQKLRRRWLSGALTVKKDWQMLRV